MSTAAAASTSEHRREIAAGSDATLAAVERAAEGWGAAWTRHGTGGELALPVLHGVRRGWVRAELTGEPTSGGRTALRLAVTERHEGVHVAAVVILLISAAGGILVGAWPFFPRLLPLAPIGAILALGGWFLVVSRLRSSGPEEFLELVDKLAGEEPEPSA